MTDGETPEEALRNLDEAQAGWFEAALMHGDAIPEPGPPETYLRFEQSI